MAKSNSFWQLFLFYLSQQILSRRSLFGYFLASIVLTCSLQPLQAQPIKPLPASNTLEEELDLAPPSPSNQTESPLTISPESLPDAQIENQSQQNIPESITVKKFEVVGSSVFSEQELSKVVESYQNRPLTLSELFQVRSAITKLYTDRGYINSGAYLPPQELENGIVTIAIKEGELEGINVTGTDHLNSNYVASRLKAAAGVPVNVDSLLEALQMLRLDPLIDNVSAELSAGLRPGTSLLDVQIKEADPFTINTTFDNGRSPSVGTNRRSIGLTHANLLGFGDRFNFSYTNSDGSDGIDLAYAVPLNAKNGTLKFAYGNNSNDVIEEPFNPLDIESESRYYELSFRQPLMVKPNQEVALGISFSRQESETSLLDVPFALSRGADAEGNTKISALRLFQELVNRDQNKVFALRSQFSIGLDLFDATSNQDAPDSSFFAWRGQSQWVRRIDEDFLFLLRGDLQFATTALVPLEQFRIGGGDSVRGYRQDLLLGDNGLFASAELRIPIFRINKIDGVIQLTPFVDLGTVWNSDEVEIDKEFLSAVGIGLNFTAGNRLNARLDWGIPLVDVDNSTNSWQENGVYFSINYNFF